MTDAAPRLPVTEVDRLRVRSEAETLADVTGVLAVVIATEDGFEVAAVVRSAVDVTRIAALASSIAAIGEVVSAEARLGRTRSITVDTDEGFVSVHSSRLASGLGLVLNVIASADALLGQVHYHASQAVRKLAA